MRWLWQHSADGGAAVQSVALETMLPESVLVELDRFDRIQLEAVVGVCRKARTLSEAGRQLFDRSRMQRTVERCQGELGLNTVDAGYLPFDAFPQNNIELLLKNSFESGFMNASLSLSQMIKRKGAVINFDMGSVKLGANFLEAAEYKKFHGSYLLLTTEIFGEVSGKNYLFLSSI